MVHPIQHGDSVLLVESSARPGPLVGMILFLLFGRIGACIFLSVSPLYPEIPFVTPRIDLAQLLCTLQCRLALPLWLSTATLDSGGVP